MWLVVVGVTSWEPAEWRVRQELPNHPPGACAAPGAGALNYGAFESGPFDRTHIQTLKLLGIDYTFVRSIAVTVCHPRSACWCASARWPLGGCQG